MTLCFDTDLREQIRSGQYTGHTSGIAPDFLQVNIAIMPKEHAYDFLAFCQNNPKPFPILDTSCAGDTSLGQLGKFIDIRYDIPRYNVYEKGELIETPTDIAQWWRKDLVTFAIGCSFTFEQALINHGIPLKHVTLGQNVAMYDTNIALNAYGNFAGDMVVSMRPMTAKRAINAIQITARMPNLHGAPIHLGSPAEIGIEDINTPDYGDRIPIADNELPVFWACGVSAMKILQEAGIPFFITHSPGCMLITDVPNHLYLH